MSAPEETEEFLEAALLRVKLRRRAEVPFADQAGRIAGGFQPIGDRDFGKRQADILLPRCLAARIELVAEALLIAPESKPARVGLQ